VVEQVQSDYNAFAYVISSEGVFGNDKRNAKNGEMVILIMMVKEYQ
jgi:hypothetical protein